ncbi:MAG: PepSY domain-containing protein [Actinomycetota bacterium]
MNHGPGETLLTGGTAAKVRTAALDAVPGGTIIRVETDSAGSPYEAHVRKADGSIVTVKVDASFHVTSTDSGFGGGGPGAPASSGQGTGA